MNKLLFIILAAGLFACKSQKGPGISWGGGLATLENNSAKENPEIIENKTKAASDESEFASQIQTQKASEAGIQPPIRYHHLQKPGLKAMRTEIRQLKTAVETLKKADNISESHTTLKRKPDWGEICLQGFVFLLAAAAIVLLLYLIYLLVGAAFNISLGSYMLFWLAVFLIIAIAVIAKK